MARYRRRRYYKRKSGKWSANIQEINNNVTASPQIWSAAETIMTNPNQQASLVSQLFTVKNIEANFIIDYEGAASDAPNYIEGVTVYIMFVPQGMNVTSDYNLQHPEYIMNYKYLGAPSVENQTTGDSYSRIRLGQQYQPFKVRTRLGRKLNTGDSVILFIKGVNQSSSNIELRLTGLVRWWTKAN